MRSVDAHAVLAAHDTALPALPAVLDEAVLSERLGAPATRSYLRYKTGTSATALVDVDGRAAIASVWQAGGGPKRAKALKHTDPGDVLLDVPEEGLLVVDAMTDRHLPALQQLVRSGWVGPWLTGLGHPVDPDTTPRTLSHKPARRWVGRVPLTGADAGGHVVLRAYTRREYDAALPAHGLIDPSRCASVRLPGVLGTHRRGLIALEHLPGRVLDETVDADTLHRLGAALGEVHASGPTDVVGAGLETATDGLDPIAPVLGRAVDEADDIDTAARDALRESPGGVIHGDFSLDQVVADGDSLGIIDLDRSRIGSPLDDVASLLAAAALRSLSGGGANGVAALMDRLQAPFVEGHASTWTGGLCDDLGARTALALLSRSGEPFRAGHAEWPEVTRELIALAGSVVDRRGVA